MTTSKDISPEDIADKWFSKYYMDYSNAPIDTSYYLKQAFLAGAAYQREVDANICERLNKLFARRSLGEALQEAAKKIRESK